MKINPQDGGAVRIRFDPPELETMAALVGELTEALQPNALPSDDPVYQRLYPAGHRDDADAAAAFRDLTETGLREERLARAEACLADLASATPTKRRLAVELDAEAADRWIRVLNDLRLSMGTRLEITEDDDVFDVTPDDPRAMPLAVYGYLTAVQDSLVRALMA